jgi:hypothetical protein
MKVTAILALKENLTIYREPTQSLECKNMVIGIWADLRVIYPRFRIWSRSWSPCLGTHTLQMWHLQPFQTDQSSHNLWVHINGFTLVIKCDVVISAIDLVILKYPSLMHEYRRQMQAHTKCTQSAHKIFTFAMYSPSMNATLINVVQDAINASELVLGGLTISHPAV